MSPESARNFSRISHRTVQANMRSAGSSFFKCLFFVFFNCALGTLQAFFFSFKICQKVEEASYIHIYFFRTPDFKVAKIREVVPFPRSSYIIVNVQ